MAPKRVPRKESESRNATLRDHSKCDEVNRKVRQNLAEWAIEGEKCIAEYVELTYAEIKKVMEEKRKLAELIPQCIAEMPWSEYTSAYNCDNSAVLKAKGLPDSLLEPLMQALGKAKTHGDRQVDDDRRDVNGAADTNNAESIEAVGDPRASALLASTAAIEAKIIPTMCSLRAAELQERMPLQPISNVGMCSELAVGMGGGPVKEAAEAEPSQKKAKGRRGKAAAGAAKTEAAVEGEDRATCRSKEQDEPAATCPPAATGIILMASQDNTMAAECHDASLAAKTIKEVASRGTDLDAVIRFSTVVADTVTLQDFQSFPPEILLLSSSLLLGIPDASFKAAVESGRPPRGAGAGRQAEGMEKALASLGAELARTVPARHVSVEVDPRLARDTQAIVGQVRRLVALYGEFQVPSCRLLFRIPATWEGIEAARLLQAEGVETHAAHVYSFVQSAACAQARISVIETSVGRLREWALANKDADPCFDQSLPHGEDPGLHLVRKTYNFVHKQQLQSAVFASSLRNKQDVFDILGVEYMLAPVHLLQSLRDSVVVVELKDDKCYSLQQRLSPSLSQSASFYRKELSTVTKKSFEKGLGACAEQLLATGLEAQAAEFCRLERRCGQVTR